MQHPKKITLGEMRPNDGPRRLIVCCGDYSCAHSIVVPQSLAASRCRLPRSFGESYPNAAGSSSMLRIGTSSADFRPSHSTIAAALLVVMRSTTPRRSVQSNLRARLLLLNAAATRAVSFTRSPRLIIFNPLVECTPRTSHSKQRTTRQPKASDCNTRRCRCATGTLMPVFAIAAQ